MFKKLLSYLGLKRQRDDHASFPPVEVSPFDCPICSDVIVSCALTSCGHSFCEFCINNALIYSQLCPICRKPLNINSFIPCNSVDQIVESGLKDEQRRSFRRRKTRFEQWKDEKTLKETKVGQKVDALDTEGVWCIGIIRLKIENGEKYPYLYIHYIGWDKSYDEVIPENSVRLAPLGFYTSKNIPRYRNPISE